MNTPIGILGGTFDPIHNGHLKLAQHALQQLKLENIRLIPCSQPPHRTQPVASPTQRLEMIKLALTNAKNLSVDDRELQRQGASFTIDTLQSLRQEFPHTPLCLLVGYDAFAGLHTWHHFEKLLDYAHIVVINRPDLPTQTAPEVAQLLPAHQATNIDDLHNHLAGKIYMLHIPPINLSATHIRKQLSNHETLSKNTLPTTVLQYIQSHNIYG